MAPTSSLSAVVAPLKTLLSFRIKTPCLFIKPRGWNDSLHAVARNFHGMFCCPPSLPVTAMTSRFSLLHGYTASFIRVEPITTQRRCELTPYSQRAHLNYLTVGSFLDTQLAQSELSRWAHTVSLLLAFHEFATRTMSLLWAICEITWWAHHAAVAVSSLWVGLLWAHSVSYLWSHCRLQIPPAFPLVSI